MANYIELPGDEWGNRGKTAGEPQVIEAEERDGMLHVLTPGFPWPSLFPDQWAEVNHAPGPITEEEWAQLILSLDRLPQWMMQTARKTLDYRQSLPNPTTGEWTYRGFMPRFYYSMGLPFTWHNEKTGVVKAALLAFTNNRLHKTVMTGEQLHCVIEYVQHYICAPIWLESHPMGKHPLVGESVTDLRQKAVVLQTPDDIHAWINAALSIGIDPL